MTEKDRVVPAWTRAGMEPTLNGTGFMFSTLDEFAEDFIQYAGQTDGPVLDLGCAYGVVTIAALEVGGTVTACDLDQRHLDILLDKTPAKFHPKLERVQGCLPNIDLTPNSFSAIICSRVLHFLDGSAIDASVRNMYSWLKPGGRLYLIADTPYGIWRKLIPIFEQKKKTGERWPGMMIGLENYLPYARKNPRFDGPPFMNLLDPEILERICTDAGFQVQRSSYIDRADFGDLGRMDGRENAGILAMKADL